MQVMCTAGVAFLLSQRSSAAKQDIVGSIRAAMAFQVKESVGPATIAAADRALAARVVKALASNPRISLLGPAGEDRLPIFSFLIKAPATPDPTGAQAPSSRFLHFNFVCAVLNDVFGVQTRGGCACAGPYSLRLLGIPPTTAARLEAALLDKTEVICRPLPATPHLAFLRLLLLACAQIPFPPSPGWQASTAGLCGIPVLPRLI